MLTEAENEAARQKAAAITEAKKLREDARLNGVYALDEARKTAQEANKKLLEQAEKQAKMQAEQLQQQAKEQCVLLRKTAQERMQQAAAEIRRRVVSPEWQS